MLVLSLGTTLCSSDHPNLTLDSLCGAGPTFLSLAIPFCTQCVSSLKQTLPKKAPNHITAVRPDCTSYGDVAARSALGTAGPRWLCSHAYGGDFISFTNPSEVSRHQVTQCNCRTQKSISFKPHISWYDNWKHIAFMLQSLNWEQRWLLHQYMLNSTRYCNKIWFSRWKQVVGKQESWSGRME